MTSHPPVLHLLCGKIGAGKSTLAHTLADAPGSLLVSEDHWLARLYPGEQNSLEDYVRNAGRLRAAMEAHLVALLRAGMSLVLDFPANTPASRAWMRGLAEAAGCAHRLHWLDVPDAICLARLRQRNAEGRHEFTVSDEEFAHFTRRFVPPGADEGLTVVRHVPG